VGIAIGTVIRETERASSQEENQIYFPQILTPRRHRLRLNQVFSILKLCANFVVQTLNLISESDSFLSHSNQLSILVEIDYVVDKMKEIPSSKKVDAAIIQVGENLRGKSFEEWKTLSEKEDPLVITRYDDTPLSKALFFSYMMLPQLLKPFFMAFWGQTRGLKKLLETPWIYVNSYRFKNCRLHFTFRSLCVSEAKSEKFFHILKKYTDCTPENIKRQQRLCVHNNVVLAFTQVHEWMELFPNAQSLLCFGPKQQYPVLLPLCLRLFKVLDALALRFYEFPHQLLALVHLTHLSITCDRELPNSISTLSNLEVLIFIRYHNIKFSNNGPVCLPIDIWNMHKLRQLYCEGFDLPPPLDNSHLENLLTISGVSAHSCITEVLSRIPNLNRIAVQIESAHDSTETFNFFGHFASVYEEFESFKCVVVNPNLSSQIVRSVPNIPMNIRKISLSGCGLPWENMQVIASLPNLRVLKLRWYAFCGPLWKTSTGQFPSLEFLLLEDLDIENLELDIPYLRWVIVRHCYKLENISNQFKNTGLLEVDDCNPSFMKKMRECRPFLGAEAKVGSSSTDL
ncbi:hypothetical protein MIMGU_mgv1a017989mg, partial [Erythranthe guttata]